MRTSIFKKDLDSKTMNITRTFGGAAEIVWKAWTERELLDQWWAPKPWKAETKSQDFSAGGFWLYCMVGPEGERHWARADYSQIDPIKAFRAVDSFCDENGTKNTEVPSMSWHVQFHPKGEETEVEILISFGSREDLEKIMEMGFQEGFTAAHGNLDELLLKHA